MPARSPFAMRCAPTTLDDPAISVTASLQWRAPRHRCGRSISWAARSKARVLRRLLGSSRLLHAPTVTSTQRRSRWVRRLDCVKSPHVVTAAGGATNPALECVGRCHLWWSLGWGGIRYEGPRRSSWPTLCSASEAGSSKCFAGCRWAGCALASCRRCLHSRSSTVSAGRRWRRGRSSICRGRLRPRGCLRRRLDATATRREGGQAGRPPLRAVVMPFQSLGDEGAEEIARACALHCPQLSFLMLSRNEVSHEATCRIRELLPHLDELRLRINNRGG